jgi:hypothetical protein
VADEFILLDDGHPETELEDDRAQWDVENVDDPNQRIDGGPSRLGLRPSPKKVPSSLSTKPESSSARNAISSVQSSSELQTCPICSKKLRVDNAGLNEHIDYCLSKGTIMQATADMELPTIATDIEGSPAKVNKLRRYNAVTEDDARGRLKRPKVVK